MGRSSNFLTHSYTLGFGVYWIGISEAEVLSLNSIFYISFKMYHVIGSLFVCVMEVLGRVTVMALVFSCSGWGNSHSLSTWLSPVFCTYCVLGVEKFLV